MIPVEVPCSCPSKPHPEDTVWLAANVDVRIGRAAMTALRTVPQAFSDQMAVLGTAFLHFGVREWSFVDDKGEPLPVTVENIDARLTWNQGGMEVGEKADELYAGDLMVPLDRARSKASSAGPTETSTSVTQPTGSDTDSSPKPSLHTVSGGKLSEAKAS